MRKTLLLMLLLFIIAVGCSSKSLTKQEYFEKGMSFLKVGNAKGAIISLKNAIERDQNYFEARYQLALAYIIQGKYESAEKELLKVMRLNPSLDEIHVSLAKVYLNTDRTEDALTEIDEYLSKIDDNPEAYELAAMAYAAKKDYKEAEGIMEGMLSRFPEQASSKILLSDIYLSSGKTDKSELLITEVLETEKNNVKALFILTRIKNRQDKNEEAIDAYRRILDIAPDNRVALFELGATYLRGKELEKAKAIAQQLIDAEPNRHEGHYLMGLVYFHEKKMDEAIISLQQSVKKFSIAGAFYYLGLSHLSQGNMQQALSDFQRVINVQPDMLQPHLLLAVVHLKSGRPEDAEREVKIVLGKDGKNAFAHNLLGSAYLALGKGALAMEEFDRAIELNPKLVDAHIKKGAFNLLSGDKESAEKDFLDAVEIAPDLLNNRIILAQYYIKNKKYRLAIDTLEDGMKSTPEDAVIYNMIGAAYMKMTDMNKARESFDKAIAANSEFYLPYFNLALMHLKNDEKEKAIEAYERVLTLDNNNVTALLMTAKVMESDNRGSEALAYYIKAREQGSPIAYMALAEYYIKNKQREDAHSVLEDALIAHPDNLELMAMKGSIHMAERDYKNAISIYQQMKSVSPGIGGVKLAGAHAASGNYDMAATVLKGLLLNDNNNIGVMAQLAGIYMKKGDNDEAEKTSRKMISLQPDSIHGYRVLAGVHAEQHRLNDAVAVLEKAEKISPEDLELTLEKGRLLLTLKKYRKAMEVFQGIVKRNPQYAPAYFFQASILEIEGKPKDAVRKHEKVLSISPNYIPSLNNLAYLYAEGHGSVKKAVDLAQRAKSLVPNNGSITDTLGWALYRSDRIDEAIPYFIEASKYHPKDPTIRYHMGLAYLKKGERAKAREQLKHAVRLGSEADFAELKDAQKLLKGLK